MQSTNRGEYLRAVLAVFVVGLALLIGFRVSSAARTDVGPAPQQDVIRLETRINQLEQRLYTIESGLRNLEQQSRLPGVASRGGGNEDVTQLRLEVQALQRRLIEDECGLAKLDERTLSAPVRDARRKSGENRSDPCRLNAETPLRLPDRR